MTTRYLTEAETAAALNVPEAELAAMVAAGKLHGLAMSPGDAAMVFSPHQVAGLGGTLSRDTLKAMTPTEIAALPPKALAAALAPKQAL